MMPKSRGLFETIMLSLIFYYFEIEYYFQERRSNRESKRIYMELKKEERCIMELVLEGIWGFEDPYVRGKYVEVQKKLLRFKDEKFFTTKILKL